jgi:hypothetical protein
VNYASPGCLRQIVSLRSARPGRLSAILLHGKGRGAGINVKGFKHPERRK